MDEKPWVFYLVENIYNKRTYAGVSPTPERRLRQHNGELAGGAKYTTSHDPGGWRHICLVTGFQNKIQSMQFEWAVKHAAPRNLGGKAARLKKLTAVMEKERWTSKAPLSSEVPLEVQWCI